MNREQILAMEAGDELSQKVAEEIMKECYHQYWTEDGKDSINCLKCGESRFYHQRSQAYSTDISVAWQVVEKMTDEGWYWYGYSVGGSLRLSASQFIKEIPEDLPELESKIDKGIVDGDFGMPEAICKATLLAELEGKEK